MLVLTRRIGEIIRVGDDVKINILDVKGSQVRIGVKAPDNIPIHREEIYQRIQREKSERKKCTALCENEQCNFVVEYFDGELVSDSCPNCGENSVFADVD